MELEGFNGSLKGSSTVLIVEREEEAWIPWEVLSQEAYMILLCGKDSGMRQGSIASLAHSWNMILTPTSSRDWSLLATILKSSVQPVLLVLDLGAPIPPFAFVEFLDSLQDRSIARLHIAKMGAPLGAFGHADAIIWSQNVPLLARMEVLQALPVRRHGRFEGSRDTVEAALNASKESKVQLMVSDYEGHWTLYWIRAEDSWALVKGLAERGKGLIRTGLALLDH